MEVMSVKNASRPSTTTETVAAGPGPEASNREVAERVGGPYRIVEVVAPDERLVEHGLLSVHVAVDRALRLNMVAAPGIYYEVRDESGRVWWTGEGAGEPNGAWLISPTEHGA